MLQTRDMPSMDDPSTVAFLQWALPRLGLRWEGYRKVRGTVRKRIARRLRELELPDIEAYRAYLERHPDEWARLEAMCWIPISRFHRDRGVFETLRRDILPELASSAARDGRPLRILSAGSASGEEPYTLAILFHLLIAPNHPGLRLDLLAIDINDEMIARAERGIYREGSLRELPQGLRDRAFTREPGGELRVRDRFRQGLRFRRHDLRASLPDGPFDLILCRKLAFTYFDDRAQLRIAQGFSSRLRIGGALVVGCHERLPADIPAMALCAPCIYERQPD